MPYPSGRLHHVDDHEQPGPCSRSGEPGMAAFSLRQQRVSEQPLTPLSPSSSPRSWSPTGGMARSSVTGRRYALVCHLRPCADASEFRITVVVLVQFRLVMHYLSQMSEEQTLVMYSGHPMGLFPSLPASPRAILTNGMVTHHRASSSCTSLYLVKHPSPPPPFPSGHP